MKKISVQNIIKKEEKRQQDTIDLIASENYASKKVLEALGSVLNNKYAEGYPLKRYYRGNEVADEIEMLAQDSALRLFQLSKNKWSVNVQPYSGSPANLAVYLALVPPGEKVMGMRLDMGGHLTHGHKVSVTGKVWNQISYGVSKKNEELDYDEVRNLALKERPKMIIAGYTAYPKLINWKSFREIADEVQAYLMADMSHLAGLIAGRAYPSPFPYADIVTTTTHKTLRGPRGAIVFSRKSEMLGHRKSDGTYDVSGLSIAAAIDKAVFPGLQGGPHLNQIAAMAQAFQEAAEPSFKKYAFQVIKNAKALARELQALGWRIVSGGTDSHLLLVDTGAKGIGGKDASILLEQAGIITNMNTIPYDERSPMNPSGLRLGTPAVTTRGMKEREMKKIAEWIDGVLLKKNSLKKFRKEVGIICKKFKIR